MNQKDILKILNRYKSTIFSGIACIGVGVTAWFKSTLARVISAEYHLNRNMNGIPESCGMANVQMWCDLLGIENKHHDERGWAVNDCFQFLDFNNSEPVDIGDGLEAIIISCVWEPVLDYENVDCWDSWPVSEELI